MEPQKFSPGPSDQGRVMVLEAVVERMDRLERMVEKLTKTANELSK